MCLHVPEILLIFEPFFCKSPQNLGEHRAEEGGGVGAGKPPD